MLNPRFYIIQLLGVLLLLCSYFLNDQATDLAAMHFDPNPSRPSVISKASKSVAKVLPVCKISNSQNDHPGKTNIAKYISFCFIVPVQSGYQLRAVERVVYTCPLPETYSFLFYKEINPPPPKSC